MRPVLKRGALSCAPSMETSSFMPWPFRLGIVCVATVIMPSVRFAVRAPMKETERCAGSRAVTL